MQCEVCGRTITGKPYKTIIEGARLVVCHECTMLGSMSWEIKTKEVEKTAKSYRYTQPKRRRPGSPKQKKQLEPTLELIQNFGTIIRQAREKRGLSHEELGRRLNEKISLIKKLESQKIIPNHKLVEKIQYVLKIKLLSQFTEQKLPTAFLAKSSSLKMPTLGDMLKKSNKDMEEKKSQEQS